MKPENIKKDENEICYMLYPYSKKTNGVFFKSLYKTRYKLYRNGVLLDKKTNITNGFLEKYLKKYGYTKEPFENVEDESKDFVDDVKIYVVKKIRKNNEIVQIKVLFYAYDMFEFTDCARKIMACVNNANGHEIEPLIVIPSSRNRPC